MKKKYILLLAVLLLLTILLPIRISKVHSYYVQADMPIQVPVAEIKQAIVTIEPEDLIVSEFVDAPIMLKVALAESGKEGKPCVNNVNKGSSARGCFQILKSTWAGYHCIGDILFPPDNIACARKIYNARGLKDWEASRHVWGVK